MDDSIELNGWESALVKGALFMLAIWSFEKPAARALVSDDNQESADVLNSEFSKRWKERLQSKKLWQIPNGGPRTPELIERRAALAIGVSLREKEIALSILALRASAVEFGENWDEFCMVVSGGIEWYGRSAADLMALADRLEAR